MITVNDISKFNFEHVPIDNFWNIGNERELKIHRIHSYPAKFPAFITTKALEYVKMEGGNVESIADIFCGCGTTAFEARRNNISFWGCDINPVATLIAKTKSRRYQENRLKKYYLSILTNFNSSTIKNEYQFANDRLKYWYHKNQYNQLAHLKSVIIRETPNNSDYQQFFLCAFSNILKATSIWLTKSIKPQVDSNKKCAKVIESFKKQCELMFTANDELVECYNANSVIVTNNFLDDIQPTKSVDMIITSPPYVTSYEYADLHQLSSLWLGYAKDYRLLRSGSIGSKHHDFDFSREWKRLNNSGTKIVSMLLNYDVSKAHSIAKYYLDMQAVAKKAYRILNKSGYALFVIGNTEYKGVRIDNAMHLAESMFDAGFTRVRVTKRKISNKILTPYRNSVGKFSTDSNGRKVYNEEFILLGNK